MDPASVRIRVLGPVELAGGGHTGGPKRLLLLGALALGAGRPRSVGALVDLLWDAEPPTEPSQALQVHVSKLRPVLLAACPGALVEHGAGGYVLRAPPGVVDVVCFEEMAGRGLDLLASRPEEARRLLAAALSLWRGPPLGGLADDTLLRAEVRALQDLHLRASVAHAEACLSAGDHQAALADIARLVDEHPLHEPLRRVEVLALYQAGRQADALAAFEDARRALVEELGIAPSHVLRDLHLRVLHHDPSLEPPSRRSPARGGSSHARTIAVLPFDVVGGSDGAELLASGLHNDLLVALSRIPDLTVIARTSVAGLPASPAPSLVVDELGAGSIVLGTVQSSGARFRVSIQLVDARRGVQRWASTFDDELTADNVFAVQDDMSQEIARSITRQLVPDLHDAGPTEDLEAYRLVAAGRQQFDLKTGDGFVGAVACFHEATRRDPGYATAWIGLCDALVSMDAYGHGDRHELLPRAEEAVHRALAIAPDSAAARTSRAVLHVAYQRGGPALAELEHAVRLRPGYADAHSWHSWVALITGDAAAGLTSARRAAELDPRAAEVHAHLALALAATGSPDAGVHEAREAGRLSPYATAPLYEALCLHESGQPALAVAILEELVEQGRDGLAWTECGAEALLCLARRSCGDEAAADEVASAIDPNRNGFAFALAALATGRVDSAERVVAELDRLTAWPCLLVHHHLRRVWAAAPAVHERLRQLAIRSW